MPANIAHAVTQLAACVNGIYAAYMAIADTRQDICGCILFKSRIAYTAYTDPQQTKSKGITKCKQVAYM